MKNKMLIVIAGLMAALLIVGVAGATGVFAQSPTPTTPSNTVHGPGDGRGFGLGQPELEAAAKVLNMTTDELSTALQSGKTLEQIASDQGVDYAKVQAAVQEAHKTELRDRIQQALTDGTITQENADWLLEGLDKGFIGVPGAFGFGGPHGDRGFGKGPQQAPQQQTPQTQPTQPSSQS
jgi:flagellar basal body-associated protein FliL